MPVDPIAQTHVPILLHLESIKIYINPDCILCPHLLAISDAIKLLVKGRATGRKEKKKKI